MDSDKKKIQVFHVKNQHQLQNIDFIHFMLANCDAPYKFEIKCMGFLVHRERGSKKLFFSAK